MKLGLGESYDNVTVLTPKMRAYLDITKPASTLGVMGLALMASLFYFLYMGEVASIGERLRDVVFVVVTLGFAHGGSQALNMAEDAEMDRDTEHKQNRPIPSGVITEEEARTLAWFLLVAAIARAFIVDSTFGVGVATLSLMGVFYNLSPIRAKERIISIPWQAVSRGLLSFPVVWSAYGSITNPTPWVLGLFMFFYVFGFQNSADIIDRHADEEYGIRTFVVEFGVRQTATIASSSVFLMLAVITAGVEMGHIPSSFYSMFLILPFCAVMWYHMRFNPHYISERTGNHPAWLWFYVGMVLCALIPVITLIVGRFMTAGVL